LVAIGTYTNRTSEPVRYRNGGPGRGVRGS
jgi:hypothetical protein